MYTVYLFLTFFVPPTKLHTSCTPVLRAKVHCAAVCISDQWKMVAKLVEMVDEYEKRLQEMPCVPRASYGRRMLRGDGGPNRNFLT